MEGGSETQISPYPSSAFSFLIALELEVGTAASTVAAVPPSSIGTDLLRSVQEREVK